MTAAAQRKRLDDEFIPDAEHIDRGVNAQRTELKEAYSPSPWLRFFPLNWLASNSGLRPAEKGILMDLLMMMHERGEPLPEDHDRLARRCGTTKAAFGKALAVLLVEGKVVRQIDGLWSDFIADEIAHRASRSQISKLNSSKRWGKSKGNQSGSDANAYRGKRVEVEPYSSETNRASATYQGDLDEASRAQARDADLDDIVQSNADEALVTISGFGPCYVENVRDGDILLRSENGQRYVKVLRDENGEARMDTALEVEDDDDILDW